MHQSSRRLVAVVVVGMLAFVCLGLLRVSYARAEFSSVDRAAESEVTLLSTASQSLDVITSTIFLPTVFLRYDPPVETVFGVQLYRPITESTQALSLAQAVDVYWARWPISWASLEPTDREPEDYNWANYDTWIRNAVQSDLQLIVTIVSNPSWAAKYSNGPIDNEDIAEFAEFTAALVERYDGDGYEDAPGQPVVRYWEFYNEPDAGDEYAAANYGASYWGDYGPEYAAMLCAVYPAMKAADPNAKIVLGGLAYDNFRDEGPFVRPFLDNVLNAGGGACFDVMNFHYYPPFESNWAAYGNGLSGKANYLRAKLQFHGLSKPMMVTEAGWHSEDYSVFPSTPEIQGRYVVQLFTQAKASGLQAMTWWTWIDPGNGYGPNGLLTEALVAKPACSVYGVAEGKLGLATFKETLNLGLGMQGYRFISPATGKGLYVLWADDSASHAVSLPVAKANVVSMYGGLSSAVQDSSDGVTDGYIKVTFGANPIYVEVQP